MAIRSLRIDCRSQAPEAQDMLVVRIITTLTFRLAMSMNVTEDRPGTQKHKYKNILVCRHRPSLQENPSDRHRGAVLLWWVGAYNYTHNSAADACFEFVSIVWGY